ncbi:hypothetical protein [Saccharopolyspora phatthalungensis]|uniref:Nucleotidyltransferase AbiEii toxin of type IV toxin-antitoxin system n=1 Tax=Saccharopolyspora phatthalungensis TaxID=664693 RepID=A0A840QHP5_9PSEU|nr:hypothetical protein [Saccharopolyspora phatthalungensis]MBB5158179.1 hypothetical protein [Saccharopolyspora phatthalungensis]
MGGELRGGFALPGVSGVIMSDLRRRAAERREAAGGVLAELGIFERWAPHGRPCLVGSVALDLVEEPDIDVEVYCPVPRVAAGFEVVSGLAGLPGVRRVKFTNALDLPDAGLYFQVQYERAGLTWKVDMWVLGEQHPGPRGCDLVAPLRAALTDESRDRVLAVKEAAYARGAALGGIWVYRAVLEAGVCDYAQFRDWVADMPTGELTFWRP